MSVIELLASHHDRKGFDCRCDGLPNQQDGDVLESVVKVTYDPEVDVLRILFTSAAIEESDEEKPGLILDYDSAGNIVGLEVLDASRKIENPRSLEHAVAA